MRFGLIHRLMTDSLAVLGVFALVASGKLHPISVVVVLIGLLFGLFLPERVRQHANLQMIGVIGPLVALIIQLVRLFLGNDPVPIVVEFAALLQVIRLITRRGAAHDHQIILLSLLHLIAGTVLGGGLTYAVALLGFLVFTPGALVLSHLRREVEGNYRQGARDRTGMPVDVPRILRSRRVIGRGFLLFTCSLSLPVFILSGLLFLTFPRVGFAWLSMPPISPSRMVGFSDRVDLGAVGTIRTDPTLVLRVKLEQKDEKTKPPLRRNFYLRGAVFDTYDGSSWARIGDASFRPMEYGRQIIIRRKPRENDQTLSIDLNRIDPPVVFVPGEAVAFDVLSGNQMPHQPHTGVNTDARGQILYSSSQQEGLRYRVYLPPKGLIYPEREHPEKLGVYLALPSELKPRIKELAKTLRGDESTPLAIARSIEAGLRKGYKYDLGSPSGAASDPLDHFLFESKRGHCEFYSTAMAIMLRVHGIPSRNVTGFVGGTYNRFGEFYAVRQGDAHSWVEAYLPQRGWIRFDPTPPSSAEPQALAFGAGALAREIFEAISQSWNQNIVGFGTDQQRGIVQRIEALFSTNNRRDSTRTNELSGRWPYAVGLVLIVVVLVAVAIWLRRRHQSLDRGEEEETTSAIHRVIQLYRSLETVMRNQGIARPLAMPPLTHARALVGAGHYLGNESLELTEIYMEVRYGGRELTAANERRFKEKLSTLARIQPQNAGMEPLMRSDRAN